MSIMNRIQQFARSPQGRQAARRAVEAAKDPKARRQIEQVRQRLQGRRGGPRP